jgi:hypothetical protein
MISHGYAVGDFNEILFNCEKKGGPPRAKTCMERFRKVLEDCDLHDLGYTGDPFTWHNHHHLAASYIKERLDRAVANNTWQRKFPLVKVKNGDPRHSDHRPVIVDVGERDDIYRGSPMEIMQKFEARWLEEEECQTKVQQAWAASIQKGGNSMIQIQGEILKELWVWDREVLGELQKRVRKAKKELEICRRRSISQEQVDREHLLRYKLDHLQDQLNVYRKQRAHTAWLLKGDRNTKFFHAYASKRRRKNTIKKLKGDGDVVVEGERLKLFVANHYQNLFMSHAGNHCDEVLRCVRTCVSHEMNESLLTPFTSEEVFVALESIGDLKAPGTDGMPSIFYKKILESTG